MKAPINTDGCFKNSMPRGSLFFSSTSHLWAKTAQSHVLWLIIEDAGSSGEAFINCPYAKSLWSVARHVPAHLTIVYHSLRSGSTLNPYIRGNLNVLVMYRVNNLGTVEFFYKELLLLCPQWQNFQDFKIFFVQLTQSTIDDEGKVHKSFQALGLDLSSGLIDCDMRSAFRFSDPDVKKHTKSDTPSNVRPGDRTDTRADRGTGTGKSAAGPQSRGKTIVFQEEGEDGGGGGGCC